VGSEMCIRDRIYEVPWVGGKAGEAPKPASSPPPAGGGDD